MVDTIIDSHCHLNLLDLSNFSNDLAQLIKTANDVGVKNILNVSVDLETVDTVISIAEQHDCVYASVGVHPSEKLEAEPTKQQLIDLASHDKVIAIGETGLDYYYNKDGLDVMRDRFRLHVQVARAVKKPLIIHTRDAREDTIAILRDEKADEVKGVMHCFTESLEMAQQAMDLGFYISFSGIVTFKNAKELQEVAKQVPLERMLIETDAPFLTPVPYRGKPNGPQYVRFVCEKIAELKGCSYAEVAQQTTANFQQLFF